MPKLVAGGPGKRKFWHAWVNGAELTVRFGKLGSTGQEQSKAFPSDEAATKELAKLVKQKLAKGYGDAASHFTFDDSGLLLDEIVDLPLPTPDDASAAHRDTTMREGSWSDTFWMGDYVFALEHVRDKHYAAGIIDSNFGRADVATHQTEHRRILVRRRVRSGARAHDARARERRARRRRLQDARVQEGR